MKKISKTITILFTILMLISIPVSYAISKENENQDFMEVNQQEIAAGETLEIQINLNQIAWNQIKLTLTSNCDISNIYSDEEKEIDIEKQKEEVILEIDKSKIELEKMVLYYPIPQEIEEGVTITLQGTIENLEQEDENQTEMIITSEITVKIITKLENNKDETKVPERNEDKQKEIENDQNSNKGEMTNQMKQTTSQTDNTSLQAKNTTYNSGNTQTEEVSYNGSDNNYLSSMLINGYTLNKEFNKESSTYFITVEEDISNLEVVASVEDDSATVCIAGADNLKEGENKILISVTAENGNVRNYRIYVTKG